MNTKITITLNGRVAPQQSFQLGYKYENVGDTLTFIIPEQYKPYHHYLAFQRVLTAEEIDEGITPTTKLLPVNDIDGQLVFTISSAITYYAGTYKLLFLSTENEIIDGNVNEARKVFISGEFEGFVIDSILSDPIDDEEIEPTLQTYYDKLDKLYDQLQYNYETDFYRGDYFKPSVDENGWISWERKEGTAANEPLPEGRNITGPQGVQGPYYKPSFNDESGEISWSGEGVADGIIEEIPNIALKPMIEEASNDYLNENLKPAVNAAVDAKFKYTWNPSTQTLYIETEELETVPEKIDEVKF